MKYKVNDKVRIKATNEDVEISSVQKNSTTPYKIVFGLNDQNWFREGELCDPAPVKVGDIIVDEDGGEAKVLEVFENTFARSRFGNFDKSTGYSFSFNSFKELEENGWKIKGKESDKTQEAMDLLKKEGYKIVKE